MSGLVVDTFTGDLLSRSVARPLVTGQPCVKSLNTFQKKNLDGALDGAFQIDDGRLRARRTGRHHASQGVPLSGAEACTLHPMILMFVVQKFYYTTRATKWQDGEARVTRQREGAHRCQNQQ